MNAVGQHEDERCRDRANFGASQLIVRRDGAEREVEGPN
jgi:hypothetical protein